MLKVVMQWCSTKDAPPRSGDSPAELKPSDLHDHAEGFKNEHPANKNQHQLLFNQNGDSGKCAADSEASGIAHKHLCRMRIKPKEPEATSQ